MKNNVAVFLMRILSVIVIILFLSACKKHPTEPSIPKEPSGNNNNNNNNQQPWWKLDVCSNNSPYSYNGAKWSMLNPAFFYASSLPSDWRSSAVYAAATWNEVGSRLQIYVYNNAISADVANDGKNVVCYGPIEGDALAKTYSWYLNGYFTNVDIKINSRKSFSIGGSSNTYDLQSTLTHEFGHFCGLDHVNDRTQTMYSEMPPDCIIYRTLCGGDQRGLLSLY